MKVTSQKELCESIPMMVREGDQDLHEASSK